MRRHLAQAQADWNAATERGDQRAATEAGLRIMRAQKALAVQPSAKRKPDFAELDAVPKDIEHFQQLSAASSKKQWLTEAIEAATGTEAGIYQAVARAKITTRPPFSKG
jgi:hypothetical protein